MFKQAPHIPVDLVKCARRLWGDPRLDLVTRRDARGRAAELYVPYDDPKAGVVHYRLWRRGGEIGATLSTRTERSCRVSDRQIRAIRKLYDQIDRQERDSGIDFLNGPLSEPICT